MKYTEALVLVGEELAKAQKKFPPMRSAHEGYAILLEEIDELWQEIKHGGVIDMEAEAIQVAAMAFRFLIDCCPNSQTGTLIRCTCGSRHLAMHTAECDISKHYARL